MNKVWASREVHHRLLYAPPLDQLIPRGKPKMHYSNLLNSQYVSKGIREELEISLAGFLIMGYDWKLDFFQIFLAVYLRMEIPGHDVASLICENHVAVFTYAKTRVVNDKR